MKNKYNVLLTSFLAMWLFFGLNACSDDSSSGMDDDGANCSSISLPNQLLQAQVTTDYFQSNSFPNEEQYSNYKLVKQHAVTGSSLSSGIAAASGYLALAQGFSVEPEANNGACEWTFDASAFTGGEELVLQVVANNVSDGIQWEVIIDGNFEDEQVNNYKYLDGFVSSDQKSGNWNVYSPEAPNTPIFTYTWEIESEDNYELTYESEDLNIVYVRNGPEDNQMTYNQSGSVTNLSWNENNDSGWIEQDGGERMCYTDFVNSACS